MHLVGPYLTTTSYKKRKGKITKAQQEELERNWRDRNKRLKEMGLPKQTLEEFMEWVHGKSEKVARQEKNRSKSTSSYAKDNQEKKTVTSNHHNRSGSTSTTTGEATLRKNAPSSLGSFVTGPCSSKPSPVYTGTKVIGVAVLHKSCLQPVFSQEEAEDIARMRR